MSDYQGFYNLENGWSGHVGMNFLPFFVYLRARGAPLKGAFQDEYKDFLLDMELSHSAFLREWCEEQYQHYYECGH